MAFIESSRITAFPLAKNRESDRKSNLFYEENIANIVNQLIDTQGFVITKNVDFMSVKGTKLQMSAGEVFQFSLGGRLFTITSDPSTSYNIMDNVTSGQTVYASIRLDENGEVLGQDNVRGLYEGLALDTSYPSGAAYVLPLFTINGTDVNIPDESYLKLTLESFAPAIKIIDGQR